MQEVPDDLRELFRQLATGNAKWPLLLHGPAGTGKTCAALCLLDFVPDSLYLTAEDTVRATLDKEAGLWRLIKEYNLVVVDELGLRSNDSDLEYVSIQRVADLRGECPAVWVTNHAPSHLERRIYDNRMFSRLAAGTWFELTGEDQRMTR